MYIDPNYLGIPQDEIMDLPRMKRKRGIPPTTKTEDPEEQVDPPDVQLEVQPEEQHDDLDKEMEEKSTETTDEPVNESKRKD